MTLFPVIRDWIAEFLQNNREMTATMVGRNMLIAQVGEVKTLKKYVIYIISCKGKGSFYIAQYPVR